MSKSLLWSVELADLPVDAVDLAADSQNGLLALQVEVLHRLEIANGVLVEGMRLVGYGLEILLEYVDLGGDFLLDVLVASQDGFLHEADLLSEQFDIVVQKVHLAVDLLDRLLSRTRCTSMLLMM